MSKRRVLINLSVFGAMFAIMVSWAVHSIVSVGAIDHPYGLTARFTDAAGVLPNAEVTYLGVSFGAVRQVRRIPGGVEVRMDIMHNHLVPAGSTAAILRKSAIGEQYIDFEPPSGYHSTSGPYYRPGDVLGTDKTTVPLEFSELLRSASNLISSISPADLATLLHEAAVGLNGRADSLRLLTDSGDRLSASLAQKTAALDQLLTANTRLTHTVATHREALGQALSDLDQVAAALRQSKGDLTTLLDNGPGFLTKTADLVASQKADLDCSLQVLTRLTDATSTPDQLEALRAFLDFGPRAFGGVFDSRDVEPDGVWVRVGFISNSSNPPVQYVPPKSLPAPRAPSQCHSTLTPSPGFSTSTPAGTAGSTVADYRPASPSPASSTWSRPVAPIASRIPSTARAAGLGLVALLTVSAVALRQVARAAASKERRR